MTDSICLAVYIMPSRLGMKDTYFSKHEDDLVVSGKYNCFGTGSSRGGATYLALLFDLVFEVG
jgi:hypothetical protein